MKLEEDLIPPYLWNEFSTLLIPIEILEVAMNPEPQGLGIGYNEELGWFILGSGQGPGLVWSQKLK